MHALAQDESQVDWASKVKFEERATEAESPLYFAHVADGYQRFRHEKLLKIIKSHVRSPVGGTMVDIGCANGVFTAKCAEILQPDSSLGLDFVEHLVADARRNHERVIFCVAALPSIPVRRRGARMVILNEVLYYLTSRGQHLAVTNVADMLEEGGTLVLSSNVRPPRDSLDELVILLRDHFSVEHVAIWRMGVYHAITALPRRILRLRELIENDSIPSSASRRVQFESVKRWAKKPFFYWLLCKADLLAQSVVRVKWLPVMFCRFDLLSPATNVTIIARKKPSPH